MCPRRCHADRAGGRVGYCNSPDAFCVSDILYHRWEEPVLCGPDGVIAVFFTGCNLKCVYCQNSAISRGGVGHTVTEQQLTETVLPMLTPGVGCLDLVTPTHYTEQLAFWLSKIRDRLTVPVVWNSSGYESVESLSMLEGLVDIYMPDFKYADSALAAVLSSAPDYPQVAEKAVAEMFRQVGPPAYNESGRLTRGLLVRHLVLPGYRQNSLSVLDRLSSLVPPDKMLLSLMNQYTPEFAPKDGPKNLLRRVTTFEYQSVLNRAVELGFAGFRQYKSSATESFTPRFTT